MEEIWKDIPGYENKYQVSNLGCVKSLNYNNTGKESILKQHVDKENRCQVALYKKNVSKSIRVHQLVAMAFLGHKPDGTFELVVDHIDNNSLNNRLDNLQLITNRLNTSKDKKNKASKYTGVTWDKKNNKWLSQIKIKGKSKFLGRFLCEQKASEAYKIALNNLL